MTDHVQTMAYAGETPWHGKGRLVSNDMTVEGMLEAAGLDWEVDKFPMYFHMNADQPDEQPIMRIAPDDYALARTDTHTVLDTVGSKWQPVQNHEAFSFFKRFVEAGDMKMETAGALKGGRFVWGLARLDEEFSIGKQGDRTVGYLLLSSPHKFGYSMTAALTPVRVVCWNTLNMALGTSKRGKLGGDKKDGDRTAEFRMPHSRAFDDDVKAAAEEALGLAHADMKAFGKTATRLSQAPVSRPEVVQYFRDVLQLETPANDDDEAALKANGDVAKAVEAEENRRVKQMLEALTTAPGQDLRTAKGTWWGAFNACTYTVDHTLGRNTDNRLASAWYGAGAGIKRRALELAIERAA